jgi:hypothetical protein
MKKDKENNAPPNKKGLEKVDDSLQGYPLYPASEDIYNQFKEENDIDPEDITRDKDSNERDEAGADNEVDFDGDMSGGDLDIPGSELDDEQEDIGSEDEENNYYSLGGDGHSDLDENNTD